MKMTKQDLHRAIGNNIDALKVYKDNLEGDNSTVMNQNATILSLVNVVLTKLHVVDVKIDLLGGTDESE